MKDRTPPRDIFDRLLALPVLRVFAPFYNRHREVLLYLFFGVLTTAISWGSFYLFHYPLAMNELLAGGKLPKMDALKRSHRELTERKKALYTEYRKAQRDMRQAVAVKTNIDHLLGVAGHEKKAPER